MMETGKRNTGLTDRERLYERIRQKAEQYQGKYCFPESDENAESYFEAVEIQPALEVYDIKTRDDIEKYISVFMDEELDDIRVECVRAFFKSAVSLEREKDQVVHVQAKSGIPDFIYTF